jgi:hypothetical protein
MTHEPWTKQELERQRTIFFETRVTGSPEAWAALSMVCELLRSGELDKAQRIQEAAGLNCPSGMISYDKYASSSGRSKRGGVYDDKGVLYDIPGWIVADPQDIVEEGADSGEFMDEKSGALPGDATSESRIEEAGNGKHPEADIGELVKVRVRLSGGEPDVVVTVGKEQKISVLVDAVKAKTKIDRLRLVHLGKMLPENGKLSETTFTPGQVLNAFVFE